MSQLLIYLDLLKQNLGQIFESFPAWSLLGVIDLREKCDIM